MNKLRAFGHGISAWYRTWSPWLALIFGLMVAAFLAARLSDGARAFLSDAVTIQWAAAIATAAAAIVALAVASGEERRNHRRSVLAGELAAGSMRNYVSCLRVLAKQIEVKIPKAEPTEEAKANDPAQPREALAAHVKNDIAFLRQALERIPAATIQPYDERITANVLHMIDQLHIAETAAPFPGGEEGVRISLTTVNQCCSIVERLLAPAHQNAIRRHLSD